MVVLADHMPDIAPSDRAMRTRVLGFGQDGPPRVRWLTATGTHTQNQQNKKAAFASAQYICMVLVADSSNKGAPEMAAGWAAQTEWSIPAVDSVRATARATAATQFWPRLERRCCHQAPNEMPWHERERQFSRVRKAWNRQRFEAGMNLGFSNFDTPSGGVLMRRAAGQHIFWP